MPQTYTSNTVDASFYGQRFNYPCGPVFTQWITCVYKDWEKYDNDAEHRTKPDPLDFTKQFVQKRIRQKPSVLDYDQWVKLTGWNNGVGCPGMPGTCTISGKFKLLIPEQVYTVPGADFDKKLLSKIRQQKVNLGSSLAEFRETGRSFAKFAEAVVDTWRFVKGKQVAFYNRRDITPCSVIAADLAYAFGVKPLAEDVFSATEVLRNRLDDPILRRIRLSTSSRLGPVSFDYSGNFGTDCSYRVRRYTRGQFSVRYKPDTRTIGFGNPLQWAWELIPYSFVIDWGIDVGEYLANLDILRYIESIDGWQSFRDLYTHRGRAFKVDAYGVTKKGSWHQYAKKSHSRDIRTSIGPPPLPQWKPSATWHQVKRATELLITSVVGRNVPVENYRIYRNLNPCGNLRYKAKKRIERGA